MNELCQNDWDSSDVKELHNWYDGRLQPFVARLFLGQIQEEVSACVLDCYCKTRIEQLFGWISDFPASLDAISELRDFIVVTGNMSFTGVNFRQTLCRRLLHMGASTAQILDYYVSMIKALRVVDPSDALLHFVAAPVRQYLKGRQDAVRCIVSSLIESSNSSSGQAPSELHAELRQGGSSLEFGADEDDEEGGPGDCWAPRLRNKDFSVGGSVDNAADASILRQPVDSSRGQDILSLLVSMYGSTDLFISEYRSLLADKLLSNPRFAPDQEMANLELLKIRFLFPVICPVVSACDQLLALWGRFGEEALHSCEVMLKDIEDSKRTNNAVHSEASRTVQVDCCMCFFRPGVDCWRNIAQQVGVGQSRGAVDVQDVSFTIVSENYWPAVSRDAMAYHSDLRRDLQRYCDVYTLLKKPRKLHLLSRVGLVELDLEFEDGVQRSFVATPMQVSVCSTTFTRRCLRC